MVRNFYPERTDPRGLQKNQRALEVAVDQIDKRVGWFNVKEDFGAVGDGAVDDTAAVARAKTIADMTGGRLYFPPGTYNLTADLTLDADNVEVAGAGAATLLAFTGAGIHVDGTGGHRRGVRLSHFHVSRSGAAGPAIRWSGGGAGTGSIRWSMYDVHVDSSTGPGVTLDGCYLGDLFGCYIHSSTIGLEIKLDAATSAIAANAIRMHGGEIQGCAIGVSATTLRGVGFFGTAIEGCTTHGVELKGNDIGVFFHGCYFEANAGWDIKIGTNSPAGSGHSILGCYFSDGPVNKDHSIILVRSESVEIAGNSFLTYVAEPIDVQEASAGAVKGRAWNNEVNTGLGPIAFNGATRFSRDVVRLDTRAMTIVSGATTTRIGSYNLILFDAAVTEQAVGALYIPPEWEECKVRLLWVNAGAGAGDVRWELRLQHTAAGATINAVGPVVGTVTGTAAAQYLMVETVAATIAANQGASADTMIRVSRLGGDAADTLANDAGLVGIVLERTK